MSDTPESTLETGRNPDGTFPSGVSGNPNGRPIETPEQKIVKKAIKEIIKEYKENLANALPLIEPVLIKSAVSGDIQAIKEIHDRVMDKSKQPTDITTDGEKIVPIYGGLSKHDSNQKDIPTQPENPGS